MTAQCITYDFPAFNAHAQSLGHSLLSTLRGLNVLPKNQQVTLDQSMYKTCKASPTWRHAIMPILSYIKPILKGRNQYDKTRASLENDT